MKRRSKPRYGAVAYAKRSTARPRDLENPMRFLPGTRMGYAGIKNAQKRADLDAFLNAAGAKSQLSLFPVPFYPPLALRLGGP